VISSEDVITSESEREQGRRRRGRRRRSTKLFRPTKSIELRGAAVEGRGVKVAMGWRGSAGWQKAASAEPRFLRLVSLATIYPHPHEFSRHSALDFRLYRPALKHPSLSLSSLELDSPRPPPPSPLSAMIPSLSASDGLPHSRGIDRPRCFHRLRLASKS